MSTMPVVRRLLACLLLGSLLTPHAWCLEGLTPPPELQLNAEQSRLFRAWMVRIVAEQVRRPSPRWQHRDCAGLVRFAVDESLREHDARWQQANGLEPQTLPPPLTLSAEQQGLRQSWRDIDGQSKAYVSAQALVQENSQFIGKDLNQAEPGDLLFFDQGDEQHLMVWMGSYIAYHTGRVTPQDPGLRAVTVQQLIQWKDSRWQPIGNNPNFIGLFRLGFLSR